jgi:hypothetical protein
MVNTGIQLTVQSMSFRTSKKPNAILPAPQQIKSRAASTTLALNEFTEKILPG